MTEPKAKLLELPEGSCLCAETLLWDEEKRVYYRAVPPKHHSCAYIRLVNQRVYKAAMKAAERAGALYPANPGKRRSAYTALYAGYMNEARANVLAYLEAVERHGGNGNGEEFPEHPDETKL